MRQVGRVHQINLSIKKGEPRISVESGEFITGMGLKGDSKFGDQAQLIALPLKARIEIDQSDEPGLCFEKFLETLSIDFDGYSPEPGDVLTIGSGRFRIKEKRKRCFPECEIVKKGHKCKLSSDVFYLEILQGATVACGESVFLIEED